MGLLMSFHVPIRILLDEGREWSTSQTGINAYIEKVIRGGFNTICPNIWHGNGATWNSNIEPLRDPTYQSSFDAYQYLTRLCQQRNIFIIPWVTVSLVERAALHPEWRLNENLQTPFFNIWIEEFRAYITALVQEFVERYYCDGVFIDFMRAGNIWSSSVGRQQYQIDTGRIWVKDFPLWDRRASAVPEMSEWIRQPVTKLLTSLVTTIRAARSTCQIFGYGRIDLGNPNAPARFTDYQQGRRLREWQASGLINYVFVESYDAIPNISFISSEIQLLESRLQYYAIPLLANYLQLNETKFVSMPPAHLQQNAQQLQKAGFENHLGVYFSRYYTDEQADMLAASIFTNTRYRIIHQCTCR